MDIMQQDFQIRMIQIMEGTILDLEEDMLEHSLEHLIMHMVDITQATIPDIMPDLTHIWAKDIQTITIITAMTQANK